MLKLLTIIILSSIGLSSRMPDQETSPTMPSELQKAQSSHPRDGYSLRKGSHVERVNKRTLSSRRFSRQDSPRKLAWAVLGMTTYTEDRLTEKYQPEFPQVLKDRFAGEQVLITGYLIPIDVEDNRYALSKNPFSSCFFCGQAGPETVIELRFEEDPGRFATDRYLPVEGKLRLNRHGGDLFFTILEARIAG